MKTTTLFAMVALSFLLGGAACGRDASEQGEIVRVKDPDERAGYLGVSIQNMTRRLAKSMDITTEEGALVNDVTGDSPADKAGVREEDIIVEIDGKKIADADDLRDTIRKTRPDTKVNIVVMRKDERKTLTATIGKAPRSRSYSYFFSRPDMPEIPRIPRRPMSIHVFRSSDMLGMELTELNEQLGKYFEAPDGRGVLVNEVEEDSKAEKAGFQAGDVITKIGKERIEDLRDVEYALKSFKEGDKADVEIIRKGSKKTLTVEVPDEERHRGYGFRVAPPGDWFKDFDLHVDPPDIEWNSRGHETIRDEMRRLERQLQDLGREIQTKAWKLQQELKARLNGAMS